MDTNLFNVIYTGKLIGGFELEAVVEAFATKFKLPVAKAEKVIKSPKELVLKPRLEHVKAYKLKSTLEAMGLEVKLERAALLEATSEVKQESPVVSVEPSTEEVADEIKTETAVDSNNETAPSNGKTAENIASWSLEPLAKEESETANEEDTTEKPTERVLFTNQIEHVYQPKTKTEEATEATETNDDEPIETERPVGNLIKTTGAWVVGILAAVFVILKKFGLFKFLKIGGLMTAAAFAGYESEEICMGNAVCESAIDDQIDGCWDQSGLDDYDWDNMSDEEYLKLKPKLEEQFIACFVYEETGEKVLVSPLELRFDLIDSCFLTENDSCLQLAEAQFKSCYVANDIEYVVSAKTTDFYQDVFDNQVEFKNYYSCFVDETGSPLFSIILENWDDMYESY